MRRSRPLQPHPEPPTCSSVTSVPESALDYLSDSSSTNTDQTQSSAASEFVSQSMPYENQNRMIWSNLARMSERFQISDRAAAAIANSVMQDLGLITDDDKTYVIDRSKLRKERERCRAEIRKKEQENFKLVNAIYFDGRKDAVRLFEPPTLDLTVNSYYKMVNLTSCHQQPPVIEHLTDLDIEQCRIRPLQLDHPCHNQCVERHVKMVTEAAAQVEGFERRDGLIRQKIKSRKLLKKFDTKVQF